MVDLIASRRGFIASSIGVLSGVLLKSPKTLWAGRREVKDICHQLDLEVLASSRPKRDPSIISRTVRDSTILYREARRKRERLCSMNPMGNTIWEACDGDKTTREISQMIHGQYLVSQGRAWDDTLAFLSGLKQIKAIQ